MRALLIILALFTCTLAKAPRYDTVSVRHRYYTAAYDTTLRYPVIVRWWAYQKMFSCSNRLTREDKFVPDPLLPRVTDNEAYYKNSGYDRGHNMPAFDNECDQDGNNECFYYSNITPQSPRLNRGDWKQLENHTRDLVMEYDSIKVWCGSIGSIKKIGKISVPEFCWKVLYIKKTKKYEAYILGQETSTTLDHYMVPVDSIYKLTRIKLK